MMPKLKPKRDSAESQPLPASLWVPPLSIVSGTMIRRYASCPTTNPPIPNASVWTVHSPRFAMISYA